MINEQLNKQTVQVVNGDGIDWQAAIRLAAKPLLDNGTIEKEYVQDVIKVVEQEGPYINIGPYIALAHSRPSKSVKKVGLSLLKTNREIALVNKDHPIKLWFVLAATDNTSHLEVIKQLLKVLMNRETVKKILATTTVEEILNILNS